MCPHFDETNECVNLARRKTALIRLEMLSRIRIEYVERTANHEWSFDWRQPTAYSRWAQQYILEMQLQTKYVWCVCNFATVSRGQIKAYTSENRSKRNIVFICLSIQPHSHCIHRKALYRNKTDALINSTTIRASSESAMPNGMHRMLSCWVILMWQANGKSFGQMLEWWKLQRKILFLFYFFISWKALAFRFAATAVATAARTTLKIEIGIRCVATARVCWILWAIKSREMRSDAGDVHDQ